MTSTPASELQTDASSPESQGRPLFMIIDPKLVVPGVFRRHLSHYFPEASVEHLSDADPKPGYDFYFVEGDFTSDYTLKSLARKIKRIERGSSIVALSSTTNLDRIMFFNACGFDAIYYPEAPDSSVSAIKSVAKHLERIGKFSFRLSPLNNHRSFRDPLPQIARAINPECHSNSFMQAGLPSPNAFITLANSGYTYY